AFDEMSLKPGVCRPQYGLIKSWLEKTLPEVVTTKRREADRPFQPIGITIAFNTGGGHPDRLIPFGLIPRLRDAHEWSFLSRGLEQRVRALNAFLHDVYHDQEIVRAGRIPEALILQNEFFLAEMKGMAVPERVYTPVAGIDMVRVGPEEFYVLEDN